MKIGWCIYSNIVASLINGQFSLNYLQPTPYNSTTMVAILFKPQAGWRIFASSDCVIIGSGKNESSVRRQAIT